MKLIDAGEIELEHYEPQNDLAYALGWNDCVDIVEAEIQAAPEVEAIPIKWIEEKIKYMKQGCESEEVEMIQSLIYWWRVEQKGVR